MNTKTMPVDVDGRILDARRVTPAVARTLRAMGLLNPYGDSDRKTGLWGTYRQAGRDCPASCPFNVPRTKRDGTPAKVLACYADNGPTSFASKRAVASAVAAGNALIMALSESRRDEPVRVHVSGDLGPTWLEAAPVVAEYCRAGRMFGGSVTRIVGYTYTALPRDAEGMAHVADLRAAGIAVRWSNRSSETSNATATWGSRAVKLDAQAFKTAARAATATTGTKHIACPAQTVDSVTCRRCTLCWTRPETVIMFAEHD